MPDTANAFAGRLISWQEEHGRHDLPWQRTRDAYRIWLSEIMLQQTQVATVIPYYQRFLRRFPDVAALAAAPLEAVLEAWAGLGYYARARHLHRCAGVLIAEHAGRFPRDVSQLAALPGIGRSTAAAIGVFAFGIRAAILDGNVKRVLARRFGIEGFPGNAQVERTLWQLSESLLPNTHIEVYTQALMDLGATVCTRIRPSCGECPLRADCVARRDGRQADLPVARPGKVLPERETRVLVLVDGRRVLLEHRPPVGLWGGLLSLPEFAGEDVGEFARRYGLRLRHTRELPALRHTFSHFRLTLRPRLCQVESAVGQLGEPGWEWRAMDEVESAALPAPVLRILRRAIHEAGALR
ncbi:MAG: A/G-specific adenine glycosylase [Candidatus Accumulibacter sp.]|jgi:A/G-specific adenine glycosylase|nr:A/G-specific adenine glycosylase [Accumulibacter sp.]